MDLIERIKAKVNSVQKAMTAASAGIAEIRQTITDLRTEREVVRGAPVPLDEARAALDKMLASWATAGQNTGLHVDYLIGSVMAGHRPEVELHRGVSLGVIVALLAPLLHDPLRAGVEKALAERYGGVKAGLPAAERQRRIDEIDREIAKLETLEEEAVRAAAEGGLMIDRRGDASPAAILGVE